MELNTQANLSAAPSKEKAKRQSDMTVTELRLCVRVTKSTPKSGPRIKAAVGVYPLSVFVATVDGETVKMATAICSDTITDDEVTSIIDTVQDEVKSGMHDSELANVLDKLKERDAERAEKALLAKEAAEAAEVAMNKEAAEASMNTADTKSETFGRTII